MITRTNTHSDTLDVDLLILVEPGTGRDLREHPGENNSAAPIFEAVRVAGCTVAPLHLNAAGVPPQLRSIFVVTAPAGPELDALAERLRTLPGVTTTYLESIDIHPQSVGVGSSPVRPGAYTGGIEPASRPLGACPTPVSARLAS
ncbi:MULTISPECIES: hypothetical protein [unclassified Mycobacteroides]|uniref:hypothetical protein n=1 Tax=unclassified Mycobacteroides TaxID=2618759 RepID=UPI00132BEAA0|nr:MULTISPECIES: hypothetical protein [unclassified Mycobacteroides]MUM18317.1 hypothetical protein [Mycobacteroides sp. CBMA 326]